MVFGNGVKNIQAAAYNGERTVNGFHVAYYLAIRQLKLLTRQHDKSITKSEFSFKTSSKLLLEIGK